MQGTDRVRRGDVGRGRAVVEAFLAAARGGDLEALVAVLDPDVVLRVGAAGPGRPAREVRGAANVAGQAHTFSRGGPSAATVLIGDAVGFVVAPLGRLRMAFVFTVVDGTVAGIEVVTDPQRLRELDLAVLDG